DEFMNIHSPAQLFTWSQSGTEPDGTVFTVFLAKLNDTAGGGGNCFAGHCDWRLPKENGHTRGEPGPNEKDTILDPTVGSCAGATEISCTYHIFRFIPANGKYWSSTSVSLEQFALSVSVGDRTVNATDKSSPESALAVRDLGP